MVVRRKDRKLEDLPTERTTNDDDDIYPMLIICTITCAAVKKICEHEMGDKKA